MWVYVAWPIDQGEPPAEMRSAVWQVLAGEQISAYSPTRAYALFNPKDLNAIYDFNQSALNRCDAVLAVLLDGAATLGVPIEIDKALLDGMPVALVCGDRVRNSVQVAAWKRAGLFSTFPPGAAGILTAVRWLKHQGERTSGRGMMKVTGPGMIPIRAHAGDAGFDLYVHEGVTIEPNSFADVDCGISVELPPGYWSRICGRSSTIRKRGLMVAEGIIDGGYRGPLYTGVWNLTSKPVRVASGERLAQLLVFRNYADDIKAVVRVDELSDTSRGVSGFGSTGE